MSIHQKNNNVLPDSEFYNGEIKYLIPGNKLRLLDNRRTPGIITDYFSDSAMFRWQILDFEDKGKHWDIPAEDIVNYQFEKDSMSINEKDVEEINRKVKIYSEELIIKATKKDYEDTQEKIEELIISITKWLKNNSVFFYENNTIDFNLMRGPKSLAQDLVNYMKEKELLELEEKTTQIQVLNPSSGEWMKGQYIVFAELGLIDYVGKIPRTKDIWDGIGKKDFRIKYILHRLAFIRAYFEVLYISEVELFRGMSSNKDWGAHMNKPLVSFTFSNKVAESFFKPGKTSKHAYFLKRTIPVEKLFMTYLETSAMNQQYKEAEALVFYEEVDAMLW